MIVGFLIWMVVMLGIQFILTFVLTQLGFGYMQIQIVINLVLGFLFAYVSYRGNRRVFYKDPTFHARFAGYFAVLMLISVIFY